MKFFKSSETFNLERPDQTLKIYCVVSPAGEALPITQEIVVLNGGKFMVTGVEAYSLPGWRLTEEKQSIGIYGKWDW
jgi:hypothetical protein